MNVQPIEIPEQRQVDGQPFPLVLSPTATDKSIENTLVVGIQR